MRVEDQRPNVIIIYCDDLGYGDLSTNGHPTILTPNLDRMSSEGMVLSQFYSGSPACTASRYALLTGKYPSRSGFDWVLYPKSERGLKSEEHTLAELFKEEGYSTGIFGKWHLGSTKEEFLPLQNGFDVFLGFPYSNDMIPPKWEDIYLYHGNEPKEVNPNQNQLTQRFTEAAIQFIDSNKNKPFFAYIPYSMPHVPLHPGAQFKNSSIRGTYGDVVQEIDHYVGTILNYLEENHLKDNTIVIFSSDNGPWIIKNEKGGSAGLFRDGKGSTWEGGMRVPAIVWGHKTRSGTTNTNVHSVLDLYPTFQQLLKTNTSDYNTTDGVTISSLLKDSLQHSSLLSEDRVLFYEGVSNQLFAVRKGKWKLHIKTYSQTGTFYFDRRNFLLFNIEEDPEERFEVSEKFPDVVSDLVEIIKNQYHNEPDSLIYTFNSEDLH